MLRHHLWILCSILTSIACGARSELDARASAVGGGGAASGGTASTGGKAATGGTVATGGTPATGGKTATGGTIATGGTPTTGVTTGESQPAGGAQSTGGSTSTRLVAKAVASGSGHTCALLTNGTVQCWGDNLDGELGNGTTANSSVPVTVAGITDATAVTTGFIHTCAQLTDSSASGPSRCRTCEEGPSREAQKHGAVPTAWSRPRSRQSPPPSSCRQLRGGWHCSWAISTMRR